MHEAAEYDHPDVIRLLASHGAQLNAADKVLSTIIEIGLAALPVIYGVFCNCAMLFVFGCVVGVIAVVFACRMATLL